MKKNIVKNRITSLLVNYKSRNIDSLMSHHLSRSLIV